MSTPPTVDTVNIDDIDPDEQARRIFAVSRDFGWTLAEAEKWLSPSLGYDPDE